MRCRICNNLKITLIEPVTSNNIWECKICGNMLDANGTIITSD